MVPPDLKVLKPHEHTMKTSNAVLLTSVLLFLLTVTQLMSHFSSNHRLKANESFDLNDRSPDQRFEFLDADRVCDDLDTVDDIMQAVERDLPCTRDIRDRFLDIEVRRYQINSVTRTVLNLNSR